MGAVNLVVVVESMRTIISHHGDEDTNKLHVSSLIAVASALGKASTCTGESDVDPMLGVKFVLFLYCMSFRHVSSQVHTLWEDHRNDLFINGFGRSTSLFDRCIRFDSSKVFSCLPAEANSGGVCILP